jgi:hypothetical protein
MNDCMVLMPVTRPELLGYASLPIGADGWALLCQIDRGAGVQATRNSLLTKALSEGAQYIRMADDDDKLLPHREHALEALADPDVDVAYFDFIFNNRGASNQILFTGDLEKDSRMIPPPWSWVAKGSALGRLHQECPLFDPAIVRLHGGWVWLRMLQAGLRFKHVPVLAYEWRRGFVFPHITQKPYPKDEMADLVTGFNAHFEGGGE